MHYALHNQGGKWAHDFINLANLKTSKSKFHIYCLQRLYRFPSKALVESFMLF